MKLRTRMTKNVVGEWYADGWEDDSLHDSMAAHALLQSMRDWFSPGQAAAMDGIVAGADQLMREGGFDSGEVE